MCFFSHFTRFHSFTLHILYAVAVLILGAAELNFLLIVVQIVIYFA